MLREFSPDDLSRLKRLERVLKTVSQDLNLPQVVCLLIIGANPGLSVNALSESSGYPQQSTSRHISILLGRYQIDPETPPIEPLITQGVNAEDPKKRALFLTDRGRRILRDLISASDLNER